MINGKRVLALIPARGGSKGLPGKNIRPLLGKPLIAWSIERSLQSKYVDETLVSTDSHEIAEISKEYGASVPFIRPRHLATDQASSFSVVEHALDYYKTEQKMSFDYLVLLEPTSPLREEDDIDRMLTLLDAKKGVFDSIVSVGEVTEHPSIMKSLHGDRLRAFCQELKQTNRRQENEPAFFPYGVAYIVKVDSLMEERTFYTERCTFFKIKRYQNFEIDNMYDFLCIENVMKHEWNLK